VRSAWPQGDDLVVQLRVDDTRTPAPQSARSASLILRWPPDLGTETTGLDGMVKKVLPAYFRSQRQIIIDAEALLKQKRALAAERYLKRSDEIGVDQRILRLRYGQFLGEEAEGEPQAPPTNDAKAPQDASAQAPAGDEHDHAAAASTASSPGVRAGRRRCRTVRPHARPRGSGHAAGSRNTRHAQGRARSDVAVGTAIAPGQARRRAAVRVSRVALHQAGAAGDADLPGARGDGVAAHRRKPALGR
jgi:hypothetical protein